MKLTKEACLNALMNICSSSAKMEDRKVFYELIEEHFDNQPSELEIALMKACRLLHKAGVVAGKKDGKPIRLSTNDWYDKLLEDAKE